MTSNLPRRQEGQSLVETAFLLPLVMILVFNAVNLGYFFFVYVNLAAAPRQGAEYSIQGAHTIQESAPTAADVSSLVYDSFSGAVPGSGSTPSRVCVASNGLSNQGTSTQTPTCTTYGTPPASYPADPNCPSTTICPDPEAPTFVLNRVDIQYTATPIIGGTFFNLIFPSSLTFHRYIYMRGE